MRVVNIEGVKIKFTEEQYDTLVKRFTLPPDGEHKIDKPCICPTNDDVAQCELCPCYVIHGASYSRACYTVMFGLNLYPYKLFLDTDAVRWREDDDKEARDTITKIRDFLIKLPKIKD